MTEEEKAEKIIKEKLCFFCNEEKNKIKCATCPTFLTAYISYLDGLAENRKEGYAQDEQMLMASGEVVKKGFLDHLAKENAKLSKMLEIVLPKALEHENHIFYEHKRTLEQYRAELENFVENEK